MRQPHNNVAASKQWGCLTSLRLPHNIVAASQQWVCLTAMRLPHSNKAASQQWGCLTTMLMPNNSIATSQQCHCLTTMRLPPNEVSPWLWGLLFGLPHSNKFLTAFRAVARLVWSCRSDNLHDLTANCIWETFNRPIRDIVLWRHIHVNNNKINLSL